MKKLFLGAALALAVASVFGQGQLIFQNSSTTVITNALTGLPASGSGAQDDTQVALYIGQVGDPVHTLTSIGNVTNCVTPGRFFGGLRTLPGWTGTVQLQVRSWLAGTVYPSFEAAYAAGLSGDTSVVLGVSAPFSLTLSESGDPPPSIASAGLTAILLSPAGQLSSPQIHYLAALLVGTNGANGTRTVQLSAGISPGGQTATVRFQFGLTSAYGGTNGPFVLPAGFSPTNLTQLVSFSPGFIYHWNVVASNGQGTTISADQTFTVAHTPSGVLGDVNGDGIISQSELDAVYARYATNSPWLLMTNVASADGTHVIFALTNSQLGAYTAEYSANLADWFQLGPATPHYSFADTNASAIPVRHYRLRYP